MKVRKLLNCAQFICLKGYNSKANVSATNQICRSLGFLHWSLRPGCYGQWCARWQGKNFWRALFGVQPEDKASCSKLVRFWLSIYNLKLLLGCNKCSWYSNYFQSWADSKLWMMYMHFFTHGNSEIWKQKKCTGALQVLRQVFKMVCRSPPTKYTHMSFHDLHTSQIKTCEKYEEDI